MPYKLTYGEEYEVLLKPKSNIRNLYLEITNHCNLECKMCYRQVWQQEMGFMPLETVKEIAQQLEDFPRLEKVIIGGIGEPTYHPNFFEIVKCLAQKIPIVITTNGTLLNRQILNLIVEENIIELVISVDSSLEEGFQLIRKTELAPVLEKLQLLNKLKKKHNTVFPRISWEFVAMKDNIDTLPQVVRAGSLLGVTTIYVTHLMPVDKVNSEQVLYKNGMTSQVENIFRRAVNVGLATGINVVLPQTELKTDRSCRFTNNYGTVISWDGDITPCYRLLHPCREIVYGRTKNLLRKSYGNIYKNRLKEIWSSPEYMKFRFRVQNNLYPSCTDCDLVDGCDLVADTELDCMGHTPACGDCLWSRGIIHCP